jgi:hypothetical protein
MPYADKEYGKAYYRKKYAEKYRSSPNFRKAEAARKSEWYHRDIEAQRERVRLQVAAWRARHKAEQEAPKRSGKAPAKGAKRPAPARPTRPVAKPAAKPALRKPLRPAAKASVKGKAKTAPVRKPAKAQPKAKAKPVARRKAAPAPARKKAKTPVRGKKR